MEDLAFEVEPSSFVSFLGRTGAGKTTLLRIIAGLEKRYTGRVMLDGKSITKPSRHIQVVFQDYRLLPWKTVFDNIRFATDQHDGAVSVDQIEKWIEIVGLQAQRNAWPKTLSGGESGRVAFARAFVDQPRVLLLDEPFRGLDLPTRCDLQDELVKALSQQPASVLLVSHSIDDSVFLSDRIYLLSDSPMRIEGMFSVDVPRPRRRDDPRLLSLVAEISGRVIANATRRSTTPFLPDAN